MKKKKNGLYPVDSWEVFLERQDRLPNWKISLNIAIALHLVVFAGAAVLPDVGKKIEPDTVITIDLLSLPSVELASVAGRQVAPRFEKQELPPQQQEIAGKVAQEKPGRAVDPLAPEVKEVAELAESAPVLPVVTPKKRAKVVPKNELKPASSPEPVVQAKPVSLHPLKRKKKLAEDVRLAEVKEREEREKQQAQQKMQQDREQFAASEKKRLAEQRKREKAAEQERKLAARKKRQQEAEAKKKLADQRRKERSLDEAARLAREAEQARLEVARARNEYASVAQAVSDLKTPLVSGDSGFTSGGYNEGEGGGGYGEYRGERVNPAVLNQYAASLNGRISSHWQLPEIVKTKPHLRTMVALTLRRDGSIKDMRIERKSGDSFFDQSVIKALRNAAPLPVFPDLIKQSTLEFALNFTPEGLAL